MIRYGLVKNCKSVSIPLCTFENKNDAVNLLMCLRHVYNHKSVKIKQSLTKIEEYSDDAISVGSFDTDTDTDDILTLPIGPLEQIPTNDNNTNKDTTADKALAYFKMIDDSITTLHNNFRDLEMHSKNIEQYKAAKYRNDFKKRVIMISNTIPDVYGADVDWYVKNIKAVGDEDQFGDHGFRPIDETDIPSVDA